MLVILRMLNADYIVITILTGVHLHQNIGPGFWLLFFRLVKAGQKRFDLNVSLRNRNPGSSLNYLSREIDLMEYLLSWLESRNCGINQRVAGSSPAGGAKTERV